MISLGKAAPAATTIRPAANGFAPAGRIPRPAEIKARPAAAGVGRFLESVEDDAVRVDCLALIGMMREASGCEPVMRESGIVGFGSCHYAYAGGREGDFFVIGFSPRKRDIALYLRGGMDDFAAELARLGKHESGTDCLYLRSLADVDAKVLKDILKKSYRKG